MQKISLLSKGVQRAAQKNFLGGWHPTPQVRARVKAFPRLASISVPACWGGGATPPTADVITAYCVPDPAEPHRPGPPRPGHEPGADRAAGHSHGTANIFTTWFILWLAGSSRPSPPPVTSQVQPGPGWAARCTTPPQDRHRTGPRRGESRAL